MRETLLTQLRANPSLKAIDADMHHLLGLAEKTWSERVKAGWHPNHCTSAQKSALMRLCALYLMHHTVTPAGDPVANFHLSNGASLHQINWGADLSKKGIAQSAGLMVNYLYELEKVGEQHEAFIHKTVTSSRGVERLI
jgi:malonyl-CoA decarboxylase